MLRAHGFGYERLATVNTSALEQTRPTEHSHGESFFSGQRGRLLLQIHFAETSHVLFEVGIYLVSQFNPLRQVTQHLHKVFVAGFGNAVITVVSIVPSPLPNHVTILGKF